MRLLTRWSEQQLPGLGSADIPSAESNKRFEIVVYTCVLLSLNYFGVFVPTFKDAFFYTFCPQLCWVFPTFQYLCSSSSMRFPKDLWLAVVWVWANMAQAIGWWGIMSWPRALTACRRHRRWHRPRGWRDGLLVSQMSKFSWGVQERQ